MAGTASVVMSAQLSAGCDVPKDSQHGSFALLRRRSRVPNRLRRPSHLAAPTSREHGELVVVQDVLNPTTEHRDAAKAQPLPGPARERARGPRCLRRCRSRLQRHNVGACAPLDGAERLEERRRRRAEAAAGGHDERNEDASPGLRDANVGS